MKVTEILREFSQQMGAIQMSIAARWEPRGHETSTYRTWWEWFKKLICIYIYEICIHSLSCIYRGVLKGICYTLRDLWETLLRSRKSRLQFCGAFVCCLCVCFVFSETVFLIYTLKLHNDIFRHKHIKNQFYKYAYITTSKLTLPQ